MIVPEDKSRMQDLSKRTGHLWKFLDCDGKKEEVATLEERMAQPTFWDDQNEARKVSSEANRLKQSGERIETFRSKVEDLEVLAELAEEDSDEELVREFADS